VGLEIEPNRVGLRAGGAEVAKKLGRVNVD
jgi:hypothetical protein